MHHRFGSTTIDRITELDHWRFPADELLPGASALGHTELDLQIATYLIRTPDATILIDTGNGNHKHRPVLTAHARFDTDYLDRLTAIAAPETIDFVICTHLHPDHCGGLTQLDDDTWTPVFRNARHLVPAAELAWLDTLHATNPTEGPAADLARTYTDSVLPVVDAGLVDHVPLPHAVVPGVTLRALPGHTDGHLIVELTDQSDVVALLSGDAIHHPLQFDHLGLNQAGDADPDQAARSRRDLVAQLAATGALLLPAHFTPGRVHATDIGVTYTPAAE